MRERRPGQDRLAALDGLRGGAALTVLLVHAAWLLWQANATTPGWLWAQRVASFLVLRYGTQAVVLFFVLSGFVIHLRQARQRIAAPTTHFDPLDYAWRRARRLYPTLLLAIGLTALFDAIGTQINPAFYRGEVNHELNISFLYISHDWRTLLGNLSFVQGFLVPVFGSNAPLWSLAFEGFFYLLYPLIYLPLHRWLGPHRTFGIVAGVGMTALLLNTGVINLPLLGNWPGWEVLAYFTIWALGAWLADLYVRDFQLPRPTLWLIATACGTFTLMLAHVWPLDEGIRNWLWSAAFAVMILLAVDSRLMQPRLMDGFRRILNVLGMLAPFSYTLYVIHFPLLGLVSAIWFARHSALPQQGWLALGMAVGVLGLAVLLAEVAEKPFLSRRRVSRRPPLPRALWLAAASIVLIALGVRLVATTQMPLSYNEAVLIHNAHRVSGGAFFAGFGESGWLYSILVAQFQPTGPEGPWIARTVSALLGALTVSACFALGRALGDWRTGTVAGLLYATLPIATLHERQALADPLLATFTAFAAVLAVRLAHKPRPSLTVLLGLTLGAACLTDFVMLPYLALPVVAMTVFARGRGGYLHNLLAVALALGSMISLLLAYQLAAQYGAPVGATTSLLPGHESLTQMFGNLEILQGGAFQLSGWGTMGLVVLAVVWAALGERRREILFLMLSALPPSLMPLLASREMVGETTALHYLLASAPLLITLAALSLQIGVRRLSAVSCGAAQWVGAALLAVTTGSALWLDVTLIRDPWQVLPVDASYRTNLTEVTETLMTARSAGSERPINVLGYGPEGPMLDAYLGPRVANVVTSPQAVEVELPEWLARGEQVFFADSRLAESSGYQGLTQGPPEGAQLMLVNSYRITDGALNLYRIVGADGVLASTIYQASAPNPFHLSEDYAAWAEAFRASESPGVVLVFPPNHAMPLTELTGLETVPLVVESWPLNPQALRAALDQIDLSDDSARVEVALVDEANADPEHIIAWVFQQRMYRLGEEWFGYLHRLSYITGPANPDMVPLGAVFADAIELTAGAVLDAEGQPSDTIRVALTWRTATPVQDSLVVFAHVVDRTGTLLAQHDAVPGEGLLPMTTWQPGEPVVDRFAIELPADTPPGAYEVRVGVYHPETGIRLAVTDDSEAGQDYVVIGGFNVHVAEIGATPNAAIISCSSGGIGRLWPEKEMVY